MAQTITVQEAVERIRDAGGRLFSVVFTKKDGSERSMVCRRSVKKGVTGKGLKFDPSARGLLPVFDMNKPTPDGQGAFRMITLDGLRRLRVNGQTFKVVHG